LGGNREKRRKTKRKRKKNQRVVKGGLCKRGEPREVEKRGRVEPLKKEKRNTEKGFETRAQAKPAAQDRKKRNNKGRKKKEIGLLGLKKVAPGSSKHLGEG